MIKVGTLMPTRKTQDLEFVQGQSRDVPDRELGPNNNTFAQMPWMVKPYSRRQLTREERTAGVW